MPNFMRMSSIDAQFLRKKAKIQKFNDKPTAKGKGIIPDFGAAPNKVCVFPS